LIMEPRYIRATNTIAGAAISDWLSTAQESQGAPAP
jgi:hypothetical protein